jgi:hypothetical protein
MNGYGWAMIYACVFLVVGSGQSSQSFHKQKSVCKDDERCWTFWDLGPKEGPAKSLILLDWPLYDLRFWNSRDTADCQMELYQ